MIRSQQLDYAEHGMDAPPELERLAQRALVLGDEMTTGLPVDSSRVHGWHRLAVSGATREECLERARRVIQLYQRELRVSLQHPKGQEALAREFIPGEPLANTGYLRRMPVKLLAAALPQAASTVGDRRGDLIGRTAGHVPPAGLPGPALPDGGAGALRPRRVRGRAGRWQVDAARCAGLPGRAAGRTGDPARPVRAAGPAVPDAGAAAVLPGAQPHRVGAGHARAVRADPHAAAAALPGRRRPATRSSGSRSPTPAPSGGCWCRTSARCSCRRRWPARRRPRPRCGTRCGTVPAEETSTLDDIVSVPAVVGDSEAPGAGQPAARHGRDAAGACCSSARRRRARWRDQAVLTVITMAGLRLPDLKIEREYWSAEEQLALPMLHTAHRLAVRRCYGGSMESRKLVGLDEAHFMEGWRSGRSFLVRLARDSRKWNLAALVASQNPRDILGLDVQNLVSTVFVGRIAEDAEIAAEALRLLRVPVDDGYEAVLASLSQVDAASSARLGLPRVRHARR